MKRPGLDAFLASVSKHYDLCIWSQTSWRWLEVRYQLRSQLAFFNLSKIV
jgi:TFIIF-interacting CTD phosphatase-like protein